MGELNADRGALPLHESDQRLEAFDLRVVPDAEVVLVDEADFLDRRRLDKDEAKAAERVAAEMHDVESAAGVAALAAVMNHRRHDEAIFQREAPDRERFEEPRPHRLAAIRSITHSSHLLCFLDCARSLRENERRSTAHD